MDDSYGLGLGLSVAIAIVDIEVEVVDPPALLENSTRLKKLSLKKGSNQKTKSLSASCSALNFKVSLFWTHHR